MRSGPRREKMLAATSATPQRTEAPSWEPERKEADMAVDIEITEGIAVVTMNRPQALNAFNSEQLDRLGAAFQALSQDRSVRVVILTGAGDRAFAAGADIKEMVDLTPAAGVAFGRKGQALTSAIERLPQPVIAAVNGYAFGGGCELAIACDIRLASDNARFAQPEVGLGIPRDDSGNRQEQPGGSPRRQDPGCLEHHRRSSGRAGRRGSELRRRLRRLQSERGHARLCREAASRFRRRLVRALWKLKRFDPAAQRM